MAPSKSTSRSPKFKDLTGQTFGRWTVLGLSQRDDWISGGTRWICQCECGTVRDVQRCGLITGASQSCGCLHRERVSGQKKSPYMVKCLACGQDFHTYPSNHRIYCSVGCARVHSAGCRTHGASRTRLHGIWCHMKSRCRPGSQAAAYYSDRGITVCPEWEASFETFRDWAMANGYRDDLEIDRADVNGDYGPDNCRWATRTQQMQNTRKRKDAQTSRFKGVSWCANSGRWRAQIHQNKKPVHIGLFVDEEDAARAYDVEARRLFGEYAHTNQQGGGSS